MAWNCPTCGPTDERVHGADDAWHCLECDAALDWVSDLADDKVIDISWRGGNNSPYVKRKKRKQSIEDEGRDQRKSALVLAKMRRRNSPKKKKRKKKAEPTMSTDRYGTCAACGEHKYLLKSKGAPEELRCTGCYKRENPETKPRTYKKRKAKAAQVVEAVPEDDITRETRAMRECARALDGLSDDSIRRVLRYVADRHDSAHAFPGPVPALTG